MKTSSKKESTVYNDRSGNSKQTSSSKIKETSKTPRTSKKNEKTTKSKSKLTKVHTKKVPKQKLKEVLEIIQDHEHFFWLDRNASCAEAIHHADNNETMHSDLHGFNLRMARFCLMRRDWRNLSKILTMSNPSGIRSNSFLYPLCVKYATICLSHNDEPLLNAYLNSLTTSVINDEVIVKCTQYSHSE